MANTTSKILTMDEIKVFCKYWVVILSAAITYLLFLGISKV